MQSRTKNKAQPPSTASTQCCPSVGCWKPASQKKVWIIRSFGRKQSQLSPRSGNDDWKPLTSDTIEPQISFLGKL